MVFYDFEFFCYFFWNFLAGVQYQRNAGLKFVSPFPGRSHTVLAKNNARKRFSNLIEIFCNFFRNFLIRVEYERNSGLNFFFLFLSLSHLCFDRNKAVMIFFNLLNCFAIFFGIFLPESTMNVIRN